VTAWPEGAYRVLLTRVGQAPARALWNGAAISPLFLDSARSVIVTLKGSGTLEVVF
jgi:hypothetical protein